MKVSTNKKVIKEFVPFDITFTIENINEAETLYALFNHESITRVTSKYGFKDMDIRNLILSCCDVPGGASFIWKELHINRILNEST